MGRRPRCLETAALVDRDVDQHRAALHARQMRAMEQLRRGRAGNQHRADDDIRIDHLLVDRLQGRVARANAAGKQLVEQTQARQRSVEHHDIGAESGRHSRRMRPHHSAAEHRDPGRWHAGHAADQLATAVGGFSQGGPAASIASRPATSLIGASSGRPPRASVTVS